jgi:CrcB protein
LNALNLALVAAGGALGSSARYLLSLFVLRTWRSSFPVGTFLINLIGCVVFGVIAGAAERRVPLTPAARAFLLVGVLGGFTTFSSYAYESFALLREGQFLGATINVAGQVIAGLAGVAIGFALAR